MSKHPSFSVISQFADGELPDRVRRAVEAHLAACSPCRAELEAMRAFGHELRQVPVPAPNPFLWTRIAAALAAPPTHAWEPGWVPRVDWRPVGVGMLIVAGLIVVSLLAPLPSSRTTFQNPDLMAGVVTTVAPPVAVVPGQSPAESRESMLRFIHLGPVEVADRIEVNGVR